MATSTELRLVERSVWKACAGTSVKIPAVNSRVYYFPQGHAEQSTYPPLLSLVSSQPMILCSVAAVRFLANPETDEVFAKIRLVPTSRDLHALEPNRDVVEGVGETTVSFAKILTPSDANNGGGFSVPRFCADSIFPPLDFTKDPPVQNISVRDVQGLVWEFRHIYRGTPRRHLLTTGWSKFVNHKKLIAGDSVVFLRNSESGELFVGVRRAVRANADCSGRWNLQVTSGEDGSRSSSGVNGGLEGCWRNGRGRVTPESVSEAADLAVQGMAFEVVYYPRVGWAEFVVNAETVEESLNMLWSAGMKVKMAMETEDSSRMTWFQGTVSEAVVPDNGPWRGSPWKMLQVAWDEPEYLQNAKRVSPWQIEHVEPPAPLHSTLHPAKKSRITPNARFPTDGAEDLSFPIPAFSNSLIGNLSPSMMSYYSFPAGMQGARQSQFFVSNFSNLISDNSEQICGLNSFGKIMKPKLETVSTELNIGGSSQSEISFDSQSSVYLFGTGLVGKQGCVSPRKAGLGSFRLFGQIIHVKDPVESNCGDAACAEDNGNALVEEAESVKHSMGLPFTGPLGNLLDGLDVQRQSTPAACSL